MATLKVVAQDSQGRQIAIRRATRIQWPLPCLGRIKGGDGKCGLSEDCDVKEDVHVDDDGDNEDNDMDDNDDNIDLLGQWPQLLLESKTALVCLLALVVRSHRG